MPGPNLTPRTAGCVIDHAEAPNRCQQPRGRVHNPPLGRVEPKYHLLQGRFSITSGLRVIQARPPKVTGGLVRLGRVFHSPLLKVASARIIPCVSFTTCFQVLTPLKLFHVPPLKNITLAPKLNNPSPIRHDFSAGCGYDEADQPVFVGRCDTGIYLRGVVDLRLGIVLGVCMFLGALLGGRIALLLSTIWLRRIFIAAVLGLAVKLLLPVH